MSSSLLGEVFGFPALRMPRQEAVQEWLSFYFKAPQVATGALDPEHDLFIQQTKLKNTLREWMGEEPVTHSEAG